MKIPCMHKQSNQVAAAAGIETSGASSQGLSKEQSTFQKRNKDTLVLLRPLLFCIFLLLLTGHSLTIRVVGSSQNNGSRSKVSYFRSVQKFKSDSCLCLLPRMYLWATHFILDVPFVKWDGTSYLTKEYVRYWNIWNEQTCFHKIIIYTLTCKWISIWDIYLHI